MPSDFNASPRLVVVGGGLLGDVIAIPPGLSALALDDSGDTVVLADPSAITAHHGTLYSESGCVRLTSSGQFGAIAVNGVVRDGTCELSEGDALKLGRLVLRYRGATDGVQPPGGGDGRYSAHRDMYAAGRDIHHNVLVKDDSDPWAEKFYNTETGRLLKTLIRLSLGICVIGVAVVPIAIAKNSANSLDPSASHFGPPIAAYVGMGIAAGGLIVALIIGAIGTSMSNAAREKAELDDQL
jgi:hypothetical protein